MKSKTTMVAIMMLVALVLHGQNFEIHYDAVSVVHGKSHENSFASGVIEITAAQVKWNSGHAEDLHYLGKTTINRGELGVYDQYAWARLSEPGKVYIGVKVIDKRPFQLTVNAPDHVFVSGDEIKRKDSLVIYTDMDRDSYAIRRN